MHWYFKGNFNVYSIWYHKDENKFITLLLKSDVFCWGLVKRFYLYVTFNPGQYILFYNLCSALTLYNYKKKNHPEGWTSLVSGAVESLPVCLLCDWLEAVARLVFLCLGKVKSWMWPIWTASCCFWLCSALSSDPHMFFRYLLKFRYFLNLPFCKSNMQYFNVLIVYF